MTVNAIASREGNQFDNLCVDVPELYRRVPLSKAAGAGVNVVPFTWAPCYRWYRSVLLPLRLRARLWALARRTHLDIGWFETFQEYWSSVLQGRPLLTVHDFYFLQNLYRVRFQQSRLAATTDAKIHLTAWQQPELIHQLMLFVARETVEHQLEVVRELLAARAADGALAYLEYGCGAAPVTVSLFEFCKPGPRLVVQLADIQTVTFHYAAWRFRRCSNVRPVLLREDNAFQPELTEPLDAIVCLDVFEHLNRPLETVQRFHAGLKPGGRLLFNYVLSQGDRGAFDTVQGMAERNAVLDFVERNFTIGRGVLARGDSMGLTVARKRPT